MAQYILGIDQSTQGTKALLFNEAGTLCARADLPHRQIVNELGWVEHDPEEIYRNVIQVVQNVVEKAGIDKGEIAGVGISNQRETSIVFDEKGIPAYNAIVWQDSRASQLCDELEKKGAADLVLQRTGIRLSPYFPAAKLSWILKESSRAQELRQQGGLHLGTVDTYLVYRLTGGADYRTDYSNASRTQLFDIEKLAWDEEICALFDIPALCLPEVTDSDGLFGETDFEGYLDRPIPIHGVMGDSHGALYGQGCIRKGMLKATYGTGSSVMMNAGTKPLRSAHGLVTSLAFRVDGQTVYCLEGNINYTGAVITWLKDDVELIGSAKETEALARAASPMDHSYLVPAFSGLGAPYWNSEAQGILCGMTRTTGKAEIVRAALDCIAYQITDILKAMNEDTNGAVAELRTDGGPTGNAYLMQFQSDISGMPVWVAATQELSGMGVAYAAGKSLGLYDMDRIFAEYQGSCYRPQMAPEEAAERYAGWKAAVEMICGK
ncbi:MAG: glycerol kinase GlpK [Lachnospiraceae bacterium]|nr:glycerol kinase GlpK [Lachnospiraceae bacterium]